MQFMENDMADKMRLNLLLSTELYEELEALADDSGGSRSDVVRRALALLKTAQSGKKSGKHLGFAKNPEKLDQEIIGY
jgi:metal-responsive CopG/Arc/MetJ family transcriptional regulator